MNKVAIKLSQGSVVT